MVMDSSVVHNAPFNESILLVIECASQDKIDCYWNQLTHGSAEKYCGWLKDRFGLSWQVVLSVLKELMEDQARSRRVMDAFMK